MTNPAAEEEPPHGRGLRVWVTVAGSEDGLLTQLYQMPRTEPIHNQFVGDHGFTGLNYVYHPTSRAEMQYVCIAR